MYMVMMMWVVAALALFMLRPASMRRGTDSKPPPDNGQVSLRLSILHICMMNVARYNRCCV